MKSFAKTTSERNIAVLLPGVVQLLRLEKIQVFANALSSAARLDNIVDEAYKWARAIVLFRSARKERVNVREYGTIVQII